MQVGTRLGSLLDLANALIAKTYVDGYNNRNAPERGGYFVAEFKLELLGTSLGSSDSNSGCPAISVIIPLYNDENYIGECLDSLLAQTFTDFEVIVVDDCSTDKSAALVENYISEFDGRLTLLHMAQNSGGGALPRNKGLNFSRGEYVYFVDSDDFLTKSALEEFYGLAKDFDADVVYCEKNFEADEVGENVRLVTHQKGELVERPTFETGIVEQRVNIILERDIWGAPWCKFVRRNFLIENEIIFPNVFPCEDYFWTLNLYFVAKKFLRVPNAVYFWRQTDKSSIRGKDTPEDKFNLWLHPAIFGLKWLDTKLSRLEVFRNKKDFNHAVLDFVVKKMFVMSLQAGLTMQPFSIYWAIKQEFGKKLGEHDVLISALCTALSTQQKIIVLNQQNFNKAITENNERIAELENELNQQAT